MDSLKPETAESGPGVAPLVHPGGRICAIRELADGGRGLRFVLETGGAVHPAFVVRYAGRVYGYLNKCAHRGLELDWTAGEFFDADRRYLICASHGARYDPASGVCIGGPCAGRGLTALALELDREAVRLAQDLPVPG